MGPLPAPAAATVASPVAAIACAAGCPVLAYIWYQSNAETIQDMLADILPSPAEQEFQRSLQEEIERGANRLEYKARCSEPPPPGLDPCERAKWELAKARDCKALRKANTDRWWGGQDTLHSPQLAEDLEAQIRKAERAIARNCPKICP